MVVLTVLRQLGLCRSCVIRTASHRDTIEAELLCGRPQFVSAREPEAVVSCYPAMKGESHGDNYFYQLSKVDV